MEGGREIAARTHLKLLSRVLCLSDQDTVFLVMEWCEMSLSQLLKTSGLENRSWVVPVAEQLCSAMMFLHVTINPIN